MANEKRLIDKQASTKLLRGKCVAKYPSTFLMGLLAAATEIEQSPEVDAVQVVRCKDCKGRNSAIRRPEGRCLCERVSRWVFDNDFCSQGERRTDA